MTRFKTTDGKGNWTLFTQSPVSVILFVIGLGTLFSFLPSLAWIGGSLVTLKILGLRWAFLWNYVAFLPIALKVSLSQTNPGDWAWYRTQFLAYPDFKLVEIFGNTFHPRNQIEEPLFYALSWSVSVLSNRNEAVLLLSVLALTFGLLTLSAYSLRESLLLSDYQALALQFILVGFGISFPLVSHLIRQSLAEAFLLFAFALFLQGRQRMAYANLVIATLIHSAALAIGFLILLAHLHGKFGIRNLVYAAPIGFTLGAITWLLFLQNYAGRDDGSVDALTLAFHGLIFTFLAVSLKFPRWGSQSKRQQLVFFLALGAGFVAGLVGEPIPTLRFYLFFEPFLALALWWVLDMTQRPRFGIPSHWGMVLVAGALAITHLELRTLVSPLGFSTTFFELL